MTHYELQLAANDGVVAIITILIMVGTGVANFIKERAAESKRKRELEEREGQPRDGRLQSEIDQFINEVASASRGQSTREREPVMVLSDDDVIEVAPSKRRRQKQAAAQQRQQPKERTGVSQRHLQESKVGQVANRHVSNQMRDHHLQSQVERSHLSSDIDLGAGSSAAGRLAGDPGTYHPVASLLMTPEGLRNAILLNEILSPPLSRRPRS